MFVHRGRFEKDATPRMTRVRSELDLFGVYVPGLLCCGIAALLVNGLLRRGLAQTGFYRLVWHRALFDVALYVVVLGSVVWLTAAVGWR